MGVTVLKRSYYLPAKLASAFKQFVKLKGIHGSPSVAGAMVVWMALPADVREAAIKAAYRGESSKGMEQVRNSLNLRGNRTS